MNALVNDTRFALRRLAKSPGFTVLAVLTLALGIGLNTGVFSLVNAVVLKPLPVEDPGELASIYTAAPEGSSFTHSPMSFPDYLDLVEQSQSYDGVAAHILSGFLFEHDGEAEALLGELATGNYFELLGVTPHIGRFFTPEEDTPADPQPVTVLGYQSWQRRFGGDPEILGTTVRLNGHPMTVIGVAEEEFLGLTRALGPELWVPMRMSTAINAQSITNYGSPTPGLERIDDRARSWHWMTARLRPGVTLDEARAELQTLSVRFQETYPETNENRSFLLVATNQIRIMPGFEGPIYAASAVVMGLVSLVLLIACSNVANMFLARAVERRKEIATRLALGASRAALVRQLLVESLTLAFAGGLLGLGLTLASNRLVESIELPIPVDLAFGLGIDPRVLLFTFGVATLTALAFGLAPAFEATRTNLATALHDEARGSSGGVSRRRLRSALVVAEVALSLLLLICAGLFVRSMANAQHIDPGFRAEGVVTAGFAPNLQGYEDPQAEEFYRQLKERLETVPGISSAAYTSHLPLTLNISMDQIGIEGQDSVPEEEWPFSDVGRVGPGYFETMGIPLLSGRGFTAADTADSRLVAVVNRTFAERFWPGEDAIGKRFKNDGADSGYIEVIGVVREGKYRSLGEDPRPFIYHNLAQNFLPALEIVLHVEGDPSAALAAIRTSAREIDPAIALRGLATAEEAIGSAFLMPRFAAALFGVFGLIGMTLAVVGIYGVISYAVSQRTHEIGIRMAMGARSLDILSMVARDGVALTGAGVLLGLVGAGLATRALESFLYGVSATDLVTFAGVSLFLTAVALVASLVPARRASSVDPLVALHYE